jgi:hypothetical protein
MYQFTITLNDDEHVLIVEALTAMIARLGGKIRSESRETATDKEIAYFDTMMDAEALLEKFDDHAREASDSAQIKLG